MIIKNLVDEDIVNYKKCSMFIIFPICSFKCDKEHGEPICQNSNIVKMPDIDIPTEELIERYVNNPLTEAVVMGGLEPFDSPFELVEFIDSLRNRHHCDDDIIIYTGYTEEELTSNSNSKLCTFYKNISTYPNIIIKFGRFIPNDEPHLDEVLGVQLASRNQYAKRIS